MHPPLAIIPVYNERDVLPSVVRHLKAQKCEVYILDNWSTDGSGGAAMHAGADYLERWPEVQPTTYDWTGLLTQIEEIALRYPNRWIMLHDADEIRRAGPNSLTTTLAETFGSISAAGYNAAAFTVRTYAPLDDYFPEGWNPELYFRMYKLEHIDQRTSHIKAWYQTDQRVDLHTHGGHQVLFEGRNVCPVKLLIKHYPIRSSEHAARKIFQERLPRFTEAEKAKHWHVQYNSVKAAADCIGKKEELLADTHPVTIVTLTRYPDIFARFAASVELHEPNLEKVVVTSGSEHIERPGWRVVKGVEPFVFARNLNLGISLAHGNDVLAVNDDVELVSPIVSTLQAALLPGNFGIATPQVIGGGIGLSLAKDATHIPEGTRVTDSAIPFVCVLLRRDMLDDVGELDERFVEADGFSGYGGDDEEFCLRAYKRGWKGVVVGTAKIIHGFDGNKYSSSFFRMMSKEARDASLNRMRALVKTIMNEGK